jgi:dTDP-4-amino-4,6-dideoxygalactose transaminase
MTADFIRVAVPHVGEEEAAAVREVLLSGRYVSGPKVQEFEKRFARFLGVRYAVAVNSGTAALHVALRVLGIRKGDEVLVPPLTFFSTISAILYLDAVPVFVDVCEESYCLDPIDIEKRVTDKTKAIIPVHLFGNAADMDAITETARKHNLKILEDAAQAHGTEYRGKKVGALGDMGIFSFFATKHMTTGEGGILTTNNGQWVQLARMIRNHGMSDRDTHKILGYNYRMSEVNAAIGLIQLNKLDGLNARRIENSVYLITRLRETNIPWAKLPHLPPHIKHTFFWCPLFVDEKELGMSTPELIHRLREKGIETRHRYTAPLYRQEVLSTLEDSYSANQYDYSKLFLRNAERVAGRIIGLPNHPGLGQRDLDHIVDVLVDL